MAAVAYMEVALEASSGGAGSETPTAPWYRLEQLLTDDGSGGGRSSSAAAMVDGGSGWQHPQKLADGGSGRK